MKKLDKRHTALILSVAAIAAAGCGSSSKSKTTAAPPATPSTPATPTTGTGTTTTAGGFSGQLSSLCTHLDAAVKGATSLPQAGAAAEPFVQKFEALTPSAAQKADFDKAVSVLKQQVTALKANDQATFMKLQAETKGLGTKLGAPSCDKD